MPPPFDNCVKRGGRVRTKSLEGGKYMHICFIDGKSHAGYVKQGAAPALERGHKEYKESTAKQGRHD